jgi:hypothetical protein
MELTLSASVSQSPFWICQVCSYNCYLLSIF